MVAGGVLEWQSINTVLLDMDGTLLDLRFDNWFWLQVVPQHFAAANSLTVEAAQQLLAPMFTDIAHTLPWYCIDHWSRKLRLDIRAMKRSVRGHVDYLPGAQGFLEKLRAMGKRVVMVTNSHPETLAIKDSQVAVRRHFDECYSTHNFGVPKEDSGFWPRFAAAEKFEPRATLFVDDSLPVLEAARAFGIAHLRAVTRPDSSRPPNMVGDFTGIESVAELIGRD